MKRADAAAQPQSAQTPSDSEPISRLSRMTLGFLDGYTCEKQGYDPYDTTRNRKPDIWRQKRKRA
jgi:hypothetical protein